MATAPDQKINSCDLRTQKNFAPNPIALFIMSSLYSKSSYVN